MLFDCVMIVRVVMWIMMVLLMMVTLRIFAAVGLLMADRIVGVVRGRRRGQIMTTVGQMGRMLHAHLVMVMVG